ncbi:flagellar biosynthesis anti-sigma factor FlgM [Oceanisphaera avium]|uniref:Negative regulator of flagellin synthesis n=1 Tax=Oceanisphaera avium TaxID=1903694 RepID=A0A1Y0CWX7_9GAMM|nr:flagellar biosynthesis anti-sigma factor FlgM [Oceanisphaera avium]ART79758.1 flagellar biosynthesis anti-sigma factor FlgM [Oceanisphaera avium]
MAIDKLPSGVGTNAPLPANKFKQNVSTDTPSTAAPSTSVAKQDSVTLTSQAKHLSQVQQSLANAPAPDNSVRLEALKKAINEGSYHVDSDRLAANISRFEQDLEGL